MLAFSLWPPIDDGKKYFHIHSLARSLSSPSHPRSKAKNASTQASPQYSTIFSCAHILPLPYTFILRPQMNIYFFLWVGEREKEKESTISVCALFHSFRRLFLLYIHTAPLLLSTAAACCICVCERERVFLRLIIFTASHLVLVCERRETPFYRHSRRFSWFSLAMPHNLVSSKNLSLFSLLLLLSLVHSETPAYLCNLPLFIHLFLHYFADISSCMDVCEIFHRCHEKIFEISHFSGESE
jgi:hypothetical protein